MQQITIAGRLGRDATLNTTQGGQSVCGFSVAVDTGFGDNKQTSWWRCSLWGRRGDKLQPYLTKGSNVTVAGAFSLGEYDGKPQLNINVSEITLQGGGQKRGSASDAGHHAEPDDLDDDVPF
jgi:single-strand DNA-binding protein